MFPGCYYAQSLIVTDRAIYRREPLPFPIGFTDQNRTLPTYSENMEGLMYGCTVAIVSFAIVYSSWLTTVPWAILVPR